MCLSHLSKCILDEIDGNSSDMTTDVQLPGWVSKGAKAKRTIESRSVVFATSWLYPLHHPAHESTFFTQRGME